MDQNQNKAPGLAVASLILGIVSFFFGFPITNVLAIVFANMSKKYTNEKLCSYAKAGRICGIISLILGIIGIVIAIAYIAVLIPYMYQIQVA